MIANHRCKDGITIIEVAVAIVVMLVGFIGTTSYRYYAALDENKATAWRNAARIGLLFSESWKSVKGYRLYEPEEHLDPPIGVDAVFGNGVPDGYTENGTYLVVADNRNYYITLSWKDVDAELQALNVEVNWTPNPPQGNGITDAYKSFTLTSFIFE